MSLVLYVAHALCRLTLLRSNRAQDRIVRFFNSWNRVTVGLTFRALISGILPPNSDNWLRHGRGTICLLNSIYQHHPKSHSVNVLCKIGERFRY